MKHILLALAFFLSGASAYAGVPTGTTAPANAASPITLPNQLIGTTLGGSIAARSPIAVTQRSPGASDDASLSYAIGNLWLAPNSTLYSALQVSPAGDGAWAPIQGLSGTLPLDLVGTASFACGLDQLTTAYTGNKAVHIQKTGDVTGIDVGFVNGKFDGATAAQYLSSTSGVGTVATCYDQSGNAINATQATAANQPSIQFVPSYGWQILFNSTQVASTTAEFLNATLATGVLPSSTSVAAIVQSKTSLMGNGFNGMASSAYENFLGTFNGSTLLTAGISQGASVGPTVMPTSPSVVFIGSVNTAKTSFANNASGTFIGTGSGSNQTNVVIGNATTSGGGSDFMLCDLVFYTRSLTATEKTNIMASLSLLGGVPYQTSPDVVVFDGDSITNGWGSTVLQGWPVQAYPMLTKPTTAYNLAVPGITVATKLSSYAASYAKLFANAPFRSFTVPLLIGTNDICIGGATAAATYANIQTYVAGIKSQAATAGVTARVLVSTLTPRNTCSGGQLSTITALNSLISAGWQSFADGLINYASSPYLIANVANTACFPDGLHPSTLCAGVMAPIAAKQINAWVPVP